MIDAQYITVGQDPDAQNRTRISFDLRGVDVQAGDYFVVSHEFEDSTLPGTKDLGDFRTLYPSALQSWLDAKGDSPISLDIRSVGKPIHRSTVIDQDGNVIFNITYDREKEGIVFTATEAFSRDENRVVDARGYTNVILSKSINSGWMNITTELGDISTLENMDTKRHTHRENSIVKVNGQSQYPGPLLSIELDVFKRVADTRTQPPQQAETGSTVARQWAPSTHQYRELNAIDSFYSNTIIATSRVTASDVGTRQRVTSTVDEAWRDYFVFDCKGSLPDARDVLATGYNSMIKSMDRLEPSIVGCDGQSITIEYNAVNENDFYEFAIKPETFIAHATLAAARDNITRQVKFTTVTTHAQDPSTVRTVSGYDFTWLDAAAFTTYPPHAIDDVSRLTMGENEPVNLIANDLFPGGDFSSLRFVGDIENVYAHSLNIDADVVSNGDGTATITVHGWDGSGSSEYRIPYEITDSNGHTARAYWYFSISPQSIKIETVDDHVRIRTGETVDIPWLANDIKDNPIITEKNLYKSISTNGLEDGMPLKNLPEGYTQIPMYTYGSKIVPDDHPRRGEVQKYITYRGFFVPIFTQDIEQKLYVENDEAVMNIFQQATEYTSAVSRTVYEEESSIDPQYLSGLFEGIDSYQGYVYIKQAYVDNRFADIFGFNEESIIQVYAHDTMNPELRESTLNIRHDFALNGTQGYMSDLEEVFPTTNVFINFYTLTAELDSRIEAHGEIHDPQNADEAPTVVGFDSRTVHHTYTNTGDESWTGLYIENVATGERTPVNRDVVPGESFDVTSASGTLTEGVNELHYRLITNDEKVVAEDTVWINAVAPAVITTEPDAIKLRAGTDGELDVLANDSSTKELDPSTLRLSGDDSWTVDGNTATKDGVRVEVIDGKLKVIGGKEGVYTGLTYMVADKDGTVSEPTDVTITVFDYHIDLEAYVGEGENLVDADTFDEAYEVIIKDKDVTTATVDTKVLVPNIGDEPVTVTGIKYTMTDQDQKVVAEGYLDKEQVAGVIEAGDELIITGTQELSVGDWMITYEVETEEGVHASNPIAVKVTAQGVPDEAPSIDVPEGHLELVPDDAPSHEVPEGHLELVPDDAPSHEVPEGHLEMVPGDAPTHEVPEGHLDLVPGDTPSHEVPEGHISVVPNEVPTHSLPKAEITVVPAPPHLVQVEKKPQGIDPNSGGVHQAQMKSQEEPNKGLWALAAGALMMIAGTLGFKRARRS